MENSINWLICLLNKAWRRIQMKKLLIILICLLIISIVFISGCTSEEKINPQNSDSGGELNQPPAGGADKNFIKTVEVPLGETGLEAVRKASPGIFYEYTDYDDSQIIGHKGFVILEKNKIEGTKLLFDGLEVEIIKIGGIYKVQPIDKINTEWCVVYKLPIISSSGKPILENLKYIEFHFTTDDLKDGKYAYLVLSKKE